MSQRFFEYLSFITLHFTRYLLRIKSNFVSRKGVQYIDNQVIWIKHYKYLLYQSHYHLGYHQYSHFLNGSLLLRKFPIFIQKVSLYFIRIQLLKIKEIL